MEEGALGGDDGKASRTRWVFPGVADEDVADVATYAERDSDDAASTMLSISITILPSSCDKQV